MRFVWKKLITPSESILTAASMAFATNALRSGPLIARMNVLFAKVELRRFPTTR